jgi:D-alanyl-lipoteichoic acid acyltransferase DltB (MBOAT superfamily)
MLLGGLWHGAAWTFVLWGAFHGALLIGHRLVEQRWPVRWTESRVWWAVKVVAMFHLTCAGWLMFRAPSFGRLREMLVAILTDLRLPSDQHLYTALRLAFFASVVLVVQAAQLRDDESVGFERLPEGPRLAVAMILLYALLVWGSYGGAPFIYFQF